MVRLVRIGTLEIKLKTTILHRMATQVSDLTNLLPQGKTAKIQLLKFKENLMALKEEDVK
jgi:hypothetical protein